MLHIKFVDLGGYRHNYKGFIKKISISNVYKQGENDHNSRCPCKCCRNSFISSLSLSEKSFKEEIQPFDNHVDTARG